MPSNWSFDADTHQQCAARRVDKPMPCGAPPARLRIPTLARVVMLLTASLAIASLLIGTPAGAAPFNKCVINGAVTYQHDPCPSSQARKDPTPEELNAVEKKRRAAAAAAAAAASSPKEIAPPPPTVASRFSCDGRQYCSQMKSCEEAKYFLANCPGVKMDGDKNGIPCEKQWCTR